MEDEAQDADDNCAANPEMHATNATSAATIASAVFNIAAGTAGYPPHVAIASAGGLP